MKKTYRKKTVSADGSTSLVLARLKTLLHYYHGTRQAGHTTAMIRGAQNVNRVTIIAANARHGQLLKRMVPHADIAVLGNADALTGRSGPLVFDNYTMCRLLAETCDEIEQLQKALRDLSNTKPSNSGQESTK